MERSRATINDKDRPLPQQYAKFIADTLDCILQAICNGSAECSGGSGKLDEHGNHVEIDSRYSLHVTGGLDEGVDVIRNVLRWGKAPTSVDLSDSNGHAIALHLETSTTKEFHPPRRFCCRELGF